MDLILASDHSLLPVQLYALLAHSGILSCPCYSPRVHRLEVQPPAALLPGQLHSVQRYSGGTRLPREEVVLEDEKEGQ